MTLSEMLDELLRSRTKAGATLDIDVDRLVTEVRASAPRDGVWSESSFDLQRGLEVSEEPLDSMPAELIDLFRKP